MVYEQVVKHWGGISIAARALGTDRRRVEEWKRRRRIPTKWQLKVHRISGGKLKLDAEARRDARELKGLIQPEAMAV